MKLPNGFGSVYKLSGKRRKPWVARKTIGWKDNGQPIYEYLGYFEKREQALSALSSYNLNPYDLSGRKLTFSEVYTLWEKQKYTDLGKKIKNGYRAAYKVCSSLHDMNFSEIRTAHMQKEINEWDIGYESKKNMRILFRQLFEFADQNDLIDKDYSKFLVLEAPEEIGEQIHKPFTDEELITLWEYKEDKAAQIVLIYCYTGMRPTELVKIKTADVFLEDRYMIGGIKTKNSKSRAIPISEKIYSFIASLYNPENEYLMTDYDGPLNYDRLRGRYWLPLMLKLDFNHLPHDGRHTCATLLDNAGVNKTVVKKILGHAGTGTTEKVYTHKTIKQLVDAINLI
ncbi:tyrosine-type recombinase/integrase [Anaerospora hongkongensis]|uniref:tyrosine-type recombinase/integrase n=1 Tax=Anaerospora hongkongensis TaxID=244830 RepID=UPI0028A0693B|nr:tyrosine-type recombinase/integrase [Anaerospora hongkongensis]